MFLKKFVSTIFLGFSLLFIIIIIIISSSVFSRLDLISKKQYFKMMKTSFLRRADWFLFSKEDNYAVYKYFLWLIQSKIQVYFSLEQARRVGESPELFLFLEIERQHFLLFLFSTAVLISDKCLNPPSKKSRVIFFSFCL